MSLGSIMASGKAGKLPVFRPERGLWVAQWRDVTIEIADPGLATSAMPVLRDSAVELLNWALPSFKSDVLPASIEAASTGCRKLMGWVAAPDPEDWACIGLAIDPVDQLWVAVQEYVADEYALWIVGFNKHRKAHRLRRAPDMAGHAQPVLFERGEDVLAL